MSDTDNSTFGQFPGASPVPAVPPVPQVPPAAPAPPAVPTPPITPAQNSAAFPDQWVPTLCRDVFVNVRNEMHRVVVGQDKLIEQMFIAILAGGHVLLEGVPGLAKTLSVRTMSRVFSAPFSRIQFTPDLLPSDITGSSIYNQKTGDFEVRPGPIFANIVLADEINRTTPKTQAALLECMEEGQVTIDGTPHQLPSPFFVIATQNNIEMSGTFPLPEAQLDRFAARISIGHPNREAEMRILTMQRHATPVDSIQPVVDIDRLVALQKEIRNVTVRDFVTGYVLDIVGGTRTLDEVQLGASPRGSLCLLHACQARAALNGRDAVTPDDVKALAVPVLAHRIIVRPDFRGRGVTAISCVQKLLKQLPVPVDAK